VIYSAWLQGAAQAPSVVQSCFQRWARLNPEYQLHVLEASDATALLAGAKFPAMPPQALSDILRVKLLLEHGGLWEDATLLPPSCRLRPGCRAG
jgi:mannosyltransferase OCH1-like enzyme